MHALPDGCLDAPKSALIVERALTRNRIDSVQIDRNNVNNRPKLLPLALLLLGLVVPLQTGSARPSRTLEPADSPHWSKHYDRFFRKYTKHYFGPGFDWHWFKAQAIAESTLKPDARSRSGARGLMQITPPTFKEIRRSNPHYDRIDEPRWNIAAGIYYMRYLYDRWDSAELPPPLENRLSFSFASYNAGFGGTRKALRRAEKKGIREKQWSRVARYAPKETQKYVRRIFGLMQRQ